MKKFYSLLFLFIILAGVFLGEYLILYPDGYSLKGDNLEKTGMDVRLEVMDGIVLDSFQSYPMPQNIDFYGKEAFSRKGTLDRLIGGEIKWMSEDGTVKEYTLISSSPVLLKSDFGIFEPVDGVPVFDNIYERKESYLDMRFLDKSAAFNYSYLFTGLTGYVNYDFLIDGKETVDIFGNLYITNKSGKKISTDNLVLFSGDVNSVSNYGGGFSNVARSAMMYDESAVYSKSTSPSSVENYKLYDMGGGYAFEEDKTGVFGFYSSRTEYEKIFMFDGYYGGGSGEFTPLVQTVFIEELPREIPAGKARLYTNFKNTRVFLGEDYVSNKSSGDSLELDMGKSSDVLGKYELLSSKTVGQIIYQSYRFTLKNLSEEHKNVRFKTSIPRDAKVTVHGVEYLRPQAGEMVIPMEIDGSREIEVDFEIQYSR